MTLIRYIEKNRVNTIAIKLIKKSKKNLFLTMILNDEIHSVSPTYINLIKKKVKQGVMVRRIGFGTKKNYKKALNPYHNILSSKNFTFKLFSNKNIAQRLLISDEKEMIFAIYVDSKNKLVFYTKSKEIVSGFINYFNKIFDKIR